MLLRETTINENDKQNLLEAYDVVEKYLEDSTWAAGDTLTIADFSLVTTMNSYTKLVPCDPSKCPKIHTWLKKMEKLPYYNEANSRGLQNFGILFQEHIN